jgi:hypothetical protein
MEPTTETTNETKQPMAECPECGKRVKVGGMGTHRRRAHGYRKVKKTGDRKKATDDRRLTTEDSAKEPRKTRKYTRRKISNKTPDETGRACGAATASVTARPTFLLEAALDALVNALVSRIEAKLAVRIEAVAAERRPETGDRRPETNGKTVTSKTVGLRAMSDQQLRDRIGLAKTRGEIETVKSCMGELKRRDAIANNFASQNSGEE